MLRKIIKDITHISDDKLIDVENYMEGISYINTLYNFLNQLKLALPTREISFLPSFKGKYTVEKLGITSIDKENEMKVFKVKSPLFLEDEIVEKVKKEMFMLCEKITREDNVIIFTLI